MTRRSTVALLLGVVALLGAGCSGDDSPDTFTLEGGCGMGDRDLDVGKVLPTATLRELLSPGSYRVVGGLVVQDGGLPSAYDGDCQLEDADGQDALRVGLIHRGDPRYAEARRALAAGDQDGFVALGSTGYAFRDSAGDPRGVVVLPDRVVVLQVLEPREGVGVEAVGVQAQALADRLQSLG